VITHGGFKLKYRITVDPPIAEQREWEHPEILVEFAGPDSSLLLERGGELLRSFELLGTEILRLQATSTRKSGSTARIFARCELKNSRWRPAPPRRRCDAPVSPIGRADVVARTPHGPSRAARGKRFAH